MASTSNAFKKCVDPWPRYLRWHTQSLRLLFGQNVWARTRCPWGENLCATSSTFAGRRHMIGKVTLVTGCVAILSYHTATQDRGSECRDFGFISRIVTALAKCRAAWMKSKSRLDRSCNCHGSVISSKSLPEGQMALLHRNSEYAPQKKPRKTLLR